MRILILGGTSFIGPEVVNGLSQAGNEVAVFHRGHNEPDLPAVVQHIHGDIKDLLEFRETFRRIMPDVVVHMIAGRAQVAWTFVRTLTGFAGRSVVISSQDVYQAYGRLWKKESGPPEPIPLDEDAPLRENLYPYRGEPFPGTDDPERRRAVDDYDKILVERIVLNEPALPGTVLRLPAVYGPRDPQHRLFNYLKRMDDGREAILLGEGAAGWRSSRGYVENVAQAIVLAVLDEHSVGVVYNVGEADALTEAEWVREIGRAAGWNGKIVLVSDDQLPEHLKANYDWSSDLVTNTGRIRRELGYDEIISRDEALIKTVAWERDNSPPEIDTSKFDYEAEDRALEED